MKKVGLTLIFACILTLVACKKDKKTSPSGNNNNNTSACSASKTKADAENITIFPNTHPLNEDISTASVDPNSATILSNIGLTRGLKSDFGSGLWDGAPIGIPFNVVCGDQAKVNVVYRANAYDGNYGDESDGSPFPIPLNAPIEGNGNGDSHVLTVDLDNKKVYELYNASVNGDHWEASSSAVFDLTQVSFRPAGWTSADAAGLPIFPCLVRYDEAKSGTIDHAIRFTLGKSKVFKGYTHPARHLVNGTGALNTSLPMGSRLRLKANFNVSSYSPEVQTILNAMKKYGLILADIGSDMYISGAPDERWNNDDLQKLGQVKVSDFEVVQIGTIVQ